MKRYLAVLLVVVGLWALPAPKVPAQALVNCIAATNTPCSSSVKIGTGSEGDPAWKAFGKINDNFQNVPIGTLAPIGGLTVLGNNTLTPATPTALTSLSCVPGHYTLLGLQGRCADFDALQYGVTANAKSVFTTASITSGQASLTVTGSPFVSTDCQTGLGCTGTSGNKLIFVPGAGSAGGVLATTISGYTSANQITLAATASTTLSAVASTPITYGTDDSVALAATAAACNAVGGRLWLPAANILLNGSAQVLLNHCALLGATAAGGTAGNSSAVTFGSTFLLTDTGAAPFIVETGVTLDGLNFYWPNNVNSGTIAYPTLLADGGTAAGQKFANDYFNNIHIFNAWDGLSITSGGGSGSVRISNSHMWAYHYLYNLVNLANAWSFSNNDYDPGDLLGQCNFSTACKTGIDAANGQNAVYHVLSGPTVWFKQVGGGAFDWHYYMLIDSGGLAGGDTFEGINLDGISTVVDSSSGGVYDIHNDMDGNITSCKAYSYVANTFTGNPTCFNLGTGSGLFLHDFHANVSGGNFIVGSGTNNIRLANVTNGGIGDANDGSDYYIVSLAGANNCLNIVGASFAGKASNAHVHGINLGTNTIGSPSCGDILYTNFTNFNDSILGATNQAVRMIGDSSTGTNSGGTSVNLTGTGSRLSSANIWDVAPVGAGLITQPSATLQGGAPFIIPPSGYMDATGNLIIGQNPGSSATVTFSGTSGSVTATYSAGTPLAGDTDAHDVGRIITVLDGSTYKWCTVTAHLTSTTATCTLNTTTTAGAYANGANWLSGPVYTATNTAGADAVMHGQPLDIAYASSYVYLPASAPPGSAGWYYCTWTNLQLAVCDTFASSGYTSGTTGQPTVPASPVQLSGLTPGTYTQTTGAVLAGPATSIVGKTLGVNGELDTDATLRFNNSAGSKDAWVYWSGSSACGAVFTTGLIGELTSKINNMGSASTQIPNCKAWLASNNITFGNNSVFSANTASAVATAMEMELVSAATDWIVLQRYSQIEKPN